MLKSVKTAQESVFGRGNWIRGRYKNKERGAARSLFLWKHKYLVKNTNVDAEDSLDNETIKRLYPLQTILLENPPP